ncbi:MAG: glycoside hydrolase family 28 protein [Bryobacteraceae bacterium]
MKTLGWITLLACAWGTSSWAQKTEQPVGSFFNVRTFGAFGDGTTLDTAAIEQAITAANAAGGGTVIFPPGIYLSGTLELLSNVTLDLQPGAVLEGSSSVMDYGNIADYDFGRRYGIDSSGEGFRVGLIVARKANNVAIVGHGTIDGNGDSFFDLKSVHNGADFDAQYTRQGADYDSAKYGLEFGPVEVGPNGRPGTMIIFSDCSNILVRDVTLSNSPNWTMHLQGSQNATISGIHIVNDVLIPNSDGIDCMRSKRVQISDCDIRAGDDDFAIVSSDDVHVSNCSLTSLSSAVRLENTRYATFSNLSIHANRGLGVFSVGVEHTAHVLFSNIVMETNLITGHWWGKAEPIYIAAQQGHGKAEIRDIHFTNITIEAEGGMVIFGTDDATVRDIYLEQIRMRVRAPLERIARSVGGNFDLRTTPLGLSKAIFKHDIPALYLRNVDGLRIRDFDLRWGDSLPAYFSTSVQAEDSKNLDFGDLKLASRPGAAAKPVAVH